LAKALSVFSGVKTLATNPGKLSFFLVFLTLKPTWAKVRPAFSEREEVGARGS